MESRKPSIIYKKLANGRSFNDKSAYDGVFDAPSKHGTPPFSAGLEDYREIFGGSRGASIPFLDFPALQGKKLSTDVRNSTLEYSKVFGALEELGFALPYEEPIDSATSSERPVTPAGRVLPPVGKDSSTELEQDEIFSHEYQKKFNMTYNRVNHGSNNSTNGITHVVQLQAASSYTCMFNEFNPLQANEDEKPGSRVDDDIMDRIKGVGLTRDTTDQCAPSLGQHTSRTNGFESKNDWYGNNPIKLKFDSCNSDQRPCSPERQILSRPAKLGKHLGYSERSMASKSEVCGACEKAGTLCSPPCFEEEVDISSVAAASAAALRKAVENAQEKIKTAKESVERRKNGIHYRKMGFADTLNSEERREGVNSDTVSRSNDKKSQEMCGKSESLVNSFLEVRNQNLRALPKVANVEALSRTPGQVRCLQEQFPQFDHARKNKPFEKTYHDENILKLLRSYEQKQNQMAKETVENPEEFSEGLPTANRKEYLEGKINLVKEKGNCAKLKIVSELHIQEDGESVKVSNEKEKYGRREKVNGQESVKEDKKLETLELVENTVKKEIKANEWIEDEKVKIYYEKGDCQERLVEHLEGHEYQKLGAKKKQLDEHNVKKQVKTHEMIEDEKSKMVSQQDKNGIRENDFLWGEDTDEKFAQVSEPGIVEDCINDFLNGEETELKENGESLGNKKHQKIGENGEMIGVLSNQIEEDGKICEPFEGKRIHLKIEESSETEIKITQNGLNFVVSKLEVTDDLCDSNASDFLNKYEGAYESLDHGEVVEEAFDHPLYEDSDNHPLYEDSDNHPLPQTDVFKASVEAKITEKEPDEVGANASLKTHFLTEDTSIFEEFTSEMETSNEVEELTRTFPSDTHKIDFGITDVEFEQKKDEKHVKEHNNDFTSETHAEESESKVEEVYKCVKEDEVAVSLQKEVNKVRYNDDEGIVSNIDDPKACFPLRVSEEKGESSVMAEETITRQSTTTIENHQASETVKKCDINDIFEKHEDSNVSNIGGAPQPDICERNNITDTVLENKKSQITAINDENHQVTMTMNNGKNSMAADSPPLSDKVKFVKKTGERETNQSVRENEEKHQTTQMPERVEIHDALKNKAYAQTCVMDGVGKCFEIDEEIKSDNRHVENKQKQQIVPPSKGTETNPEFERPAEVENEHQRKNEDRESEKEKEPSDAGNVQKQVSLPKEGTQSNHKFEILLEVGKENQRKLDEVKEIQKEKELSDLENEKKQQIAPPYECTQTKHEFERLAEAERERQRKIDEVKEREKEKERERMAVERAIREARERAFSEARERVVAERASAQTRVREKTSAVEQSGKTSIEGNNKLGGERASNEAKLRAERNAVERATEEARERALEKSLSKTAFSEAKNLAEKIVEEKLSNTTRDSERRRDLPSNYKDTFASTSSGNSVFSNVRDTSGNSNGSIGETAERHKAKLEKHQRTVERVAKALAEKNIRDLLARQEQAERNRLAESLDADIKRWSSGKEGNLRILLSTLQYILGPDSGWQPIPLTDILTATAVKKAYRKATLLVHPDKLQQRGASIQQKYICEKVFDLLKAAWNRFNAEER